MKLSLKPAELAGIAAPLKKAHAAFAKEFPGDSPSRRPVHVVYGGAHLFKADTARKLGETALRSLKENAPEPEVLAECLGLATRGGFAKTIYERVVAKLESEPVEDYRVDFEDGFGIRPDVEEDACAEAAALEAAKGVEAGTLPAFFGIRVKPFSGELFARSARTLDLFLTTLLKNTGGRLPGNFAVTLPKIVRPEQVAASARLLDALEAKNRVRRGAIQVELMVETPQIIVGRDGTCALPALAAAARGRCRGAHFGAFDYTASLNVTAAHQDLAHPACDFARDVMQAAFAGTGIFLSDSVTTIMPIGPHRGKESTTSPRRLFGARDQERGVRLAPGPAVPAADSGRNRGRPEELSPEQRAENRAVVHRAWKLAYDNIRRSMARGFYQGWDLHPAQLVPRYAATYAFFLEALAPASARLKAFMETAARATLLGDVFDDAATGQGLLNYFLRAVACGAITESEAQATGLTLEEIRGRSFLKILEARRKLGGAPAKPTARARL